MSRMALLQRTKTSFAAGRLRTVLTAFIGFGGLGVLALIGGRVFGVTGAGVEAWLAGFASGPWALPAAVALFAGLAFIGAPQFVLIAAAVAAFGPWRGAAYSWIGTLTSAAVGFGLGRRFAARLIGERAGPGVRRFTQMIARNGVAASALVRLAPAAPFVLVNIAAGATAMGLADFLLGTGLGIIPKILICAAGTAGAGRAVGSGGLQAVGLVIGALALWFALGWAVKAWSGRWTTAQDE